MTRSDLMVRVWDQILPAVLVVPVSSIARPLRVCCRRSETVSPPRVHLRGSDDVNTSDLYSTLRAC